MKKTIFSSLALAAVLFVSSCASKQTTCEITKTSTPVTNTVVKTWGTGSKTTDNIAGSGSTLTVSVEKSFMYYG